MQIIDFTKDWLSQAQTLVQQNYREACAALPALPNAAIPPLDHFAENGMGVAAVEGDRLLGFLGGYPPFRPVYCTQNDAGVWSPLHAHAVQKENRQKIWQRLYQAAGAKWVAAGAAYHSVTLYSHDTEAQKAFFFYGFGARCADLIRPLEELSTALLSGDITFAEVCAANSPLLHPLRTGLMEHLGQSPCFMRLTDVQRNDTLKNRETEPPRMFAAFDNGNPSAYIELDEEAENFVTYTPGMWNIGGAYCLPEYRGKGIAQVLLAHIIRTLRAENCTLLGVDCETFNPTAINFWSKNFAPYTYSVVRCIDENAVL